MCRTFVFLLIGLGAILVVVLGITTVKAGDLQNIRITCTSSDIPNPPLNFHAVILAVDNVSAAWVKVGLTWDIALGANTTIILHRLDRFSDNQTDGVLVYNGTGIAVNETITGEDIEKVYYTAWSWNDYGYSAPMQYLLEVKPEMVNILLLLGMLGLSFGLSGLGYYFKKSPILIVASLLWMGSGAWSFTQSAEMWDGYFFIGCVGILMGIVSAFAPWLWATKAEEVNLTLEERETEHDKKLKDEMDAVKARYPRRRRDYF